MSTSSAFWLSPEASAFRILIVHLCVFIVLLPYLCPPYQCGTNYYNVRVNQFMCKGITSTIKQFATIFGTLVLIWQVQEYPLPAVIAAATVAGLTFGRLLRWLFCPRRTREVAFQTDPHFTRNYWGIVYTAPLPARDRILQGYDLPPPGISVEEIAAGEHQRLIARPKVGQRQAKAKPKPPPIGPLLQ